MRIRSLEINGFKSFAERMRLDFDRGISAIVGPNGCGKSNVVDAIRWVMGEQNPRKLRGRAMEDLIFGGTEARPPVGMAEVVLSFDNEDGRAPPAYAAFGEIQVARRLYRSGESEYMINKVPVRLRDVLDFFTDTGVGVRGYTIVEQGQIDSIVSTKPEERRVIFEEAAGIGKYRARRRETESKLRSTEQNLLRVSDILVEIRRQIASLDRQARQAKRYKELQARVRDLELGVTRESWDRDAAALRALEGELAAGQEGLVALDAQVARAASLVEGGRRAHLERDQALRDQSEALYRVRSEIAALESRIAYERREREGLLRLAGERETEADELEHQLEEGGARLQERVRELAALEERVHGGAEELARDEAALRERAQQHSVLEGQRDAGLARGAALDARRATLESRGEALDERARELEQRLRQNEEALDAQTLRAEGLGREESAQEERLRGALSEEDELGRHLAELLRRQEETAAERRAADGRLTGERAALQLATARLETLHEAQRGEARRASELMEAIPESARVRVRGLLPELLRVEDGAEVALEAALAGRLEALLVDDAEAGMELLAWFRESKAGRAAVLPVEVGAQEEFTGFVPMGRPLAELVRISGPFRPVVERLLRGVYLVDSLHEVLRRYGAGDPPAVFVTRAGEILDRSGVLTGGLGLPPGAFSRAGEIRRLEAEREACQRSVAGLEAQASRLAAREADLAREVENTRRRRHTAQLAVVNVEKDLERTRERAKEALEGVEGRRGDKEGLFAQLQRATEEARRVQAELVELARDRAAAERARETLLGEIARVAGELEHAEQRRVQARVALAELGARREQLRETRGRLEEELRGGRERLGRRREEVSQARERAESLLRAGSEAEVSLQAQVAREEELRGQQVELRSGYETSSREVEAAEREAREAARARETLREAVREQELRVHDVRLRLEQIRERILERHGVEIASWEPPAPLEGDPEARAAELERVRESLRSLGDVNLSSIEEHEEVSERERYLSEQKADLELSIERLQSAITRINRTSRARFRETFEAIDREFRRLFPEIFRGGRAHLSLTDAEDVLEAGIEITAQPPGKKLQNINLLSGGEKSMTAIALLMAVFTVRPSPFFLLDEVDAALDDANVGRYLALLREMAETSQFLMITHNKSSIEIADRLYGVTMQEPGLSTLVTVDLVA